MKNGLLTNRQFSVVAACVFFTLIAFSCEIQPKIVECYLKYSLHAIEGQTPSEEALILHNIDSLNIVSYKYSKTAFDSQSNLETMMDTQIREIVQKNFFDRVNTSRLEICVSVYKRSDEKARKPIYKQIYKKE